MKCTGRYQNANLSLDGTLSLTMSINEKADAIEQINQFDKDAVYSIEIKKKTRKRTLDANALLWACIGDIAKSLAADKWKIYLRMLRRYGKYTYIVVKPNVVEAVKNQWRECEEVGEIDIHGERGIQMLCYFGSSTYDTKEFSDLLEGVIGEMHELGLQPPPPKSVQKGLEVWEQMHQKRK